MCLSLLGLLWFLVLQPGLTNGEAQALKKEYAQPLPGAESSGVLPAGKEQLEPESLVDLPALQTEYPDIKGWISIPGTCVDYPVLQSSADDPEYYLRRTYKGEWRTAGSIFFQWDCSAESQNTVVYGHNMNDGTMFAVLQKMTDEAFRNEHSKILLQTSNGLREYQIAAVLKPISQSSGLTALNLRIMRISCLFRKSSSHSHYTNPKPSTARTAAC